MLLTVLIMLLVGLVLTLIVSSRIAGLTLMLYGLAVLAGLLSGIWLAGLAGLIIGLMFSIA